MPLKVANWGKKRIEQAKIRLYEISLKVNT